MTLNRAMLFLTEEGTYSAIMIMLYGYTIGCNELCLFFREKLCLFCIEPVAVCRLSCTQQLKRAI